MDQIDIECSDEFDAPFDDDDDEGNGDDGETFAGCRFDQKINTEEDDGGGGCGGGGDDDKGDDGEVIAMADMTASYNVLNGDTPIKPSDVFEVPPESLRITDKEYIVAAVGIPTPGTATPLEQLLTMIRRPLPDANGIRPGITSLDIQITDLTYKPGIPDPQIPTSVISGLAPGITTAVKVPIIYITGTTATGVDVLIRCHCFRPHLYVDVPPGAFEANQHRLDQWLADVCVELNHWAWVGELANRRNTGKASTKKEEQDGARVANPEDHANFTEGPIVTGVEIHWSTSLVPEYTEEGMVRFRDGVASPFFKVYTRLPRFVPIVRHIAEYEGGVKAMWPVDNLPSSEVHLNTYESNVPFTLRACVDMDIHGHDWITVNLAGHESRTAADLAKDWFPPTMLVRDWTNADNITWSSTCAELFDQMRASRDEANGRGSKAAQVWSSMVMGDDDDDKDETVEPNAGESLISILGGPLESISEAFGHHDPKNWTTPGRSGESRAQVEIDVHWRDITPSRPSESRPNHAPYRTMAVDIECASKRKGAFPQAPGDPVVTICTRFTLDKATADEFTRNTGCVATTPENAFGVAFQMGQCTDVPRLPTYYFRTQRDMLMMFSFFIRALRPDVITGYNAHNFDFPYMLKCAQAQGVGNRFADCSLVRGWPLRINKSTFKSRGTGTRENNTIQVTGAMMCDALLLAQNSLKTGSYSLGAIARLVGSAKIEHSPEQVRSSFYNGTPAERGETAIYCAQDALLALTILRHYTWITDIIEMTRAARSGPSDIFTRGQQLRIYSRLLRVCASRALVNTPSPFDERFPPGTKYPGARVFEPKTGYYYDVPVATLDFASLYPSIMITANIDYSTLVPDKFVHLFHPSDILTAPNGAHYIRAPPMFSQTRLKSMGLTTHRDFRVIQGDNCILNNNIQIPLKVATSLGLRPDLDFRPGVEPDTVTTCTKRKMGFMPIVEIDLKLLRGVAKKAMANAPTEDVKRIFNSRQIALKTVGNSGYGFMAGNMLAIRTLAHSVTCYGKAWITLTQEITESFYSKANGYPFNASVRYGDTDSVMVVFGATVPHGPQILDMVSTTMAKTMHAMSVAKRDAEVADQDAIRKLTTWDECRQYLRNRCSKCTKTITKTGKCTCDAPFMLPFPELSVGAPPLPLKQDFKEADQRAKDALVVTITQQVGVFAECTVGQRPHTDVENVQRCVDESMSYAETCVAYVLRNMFMPTLKDEELELFISTFLCKNKTHPAYMAMSTVASTATASVPISTLYDAIVQAVRMSIVNLLVEQCAVYARECAQIVSSLLPGELSLAFEKIMVRFGLIGKKMYHCIRFVEENKAMVNKGPYWTGMNTVRRDHSECIREATSAVGDLIMKQGDIRGAVAHTQLVTSRLLANEVLINELTITKAFSRPLTKLDNKQPHIHVAWLTAKRTGNFLRPGCRIPFVMTRQLTDLKAEQAEDPFYAATHNIDIDPDVYISELHSSLKKMLGAVVPNYDRIFTLESPEELVPLKRLPQTYFKSNPLPLPSSSSSPSSSLLPVRRTLVTKQTSLLDLFATNPKLTTTMSPQQSSSSSLPLPPPPLPSTSPSNPPIRFWPIFTPRAATTTMTEPTKKRKKSKKITTKSNPSVDPIVIKPEIPAIIIGAPERRRSPPPSLPSALATPPRTKVKKHGISSSVDVGNTIETFCTVVRTQCVGCHTRSVPGGAALCELCLGDEVGLNPGVPKPSKTLIDDIEACDKRLTTANKHCQNCMTVNGVPALQCTNTDCAVTFFKLKESQRHLKLTNTLASIQNQLSSL